MRDMTAEEWAAYCESEEASFEWGTIIGTFTVDKDAGSHQYTVWIDPDNRSVPHFHVFDELGYHRNATHKDGVHTCIEIQSDKYFRHEPYMDRLGPQALMALDRFMRQVREENKTDAGLTNFRHTILAWNENNTEYREDSPYYVDPNSTSQPDYAEGMIAMDDGSPCDHEEMDYAARVGSFTVGAREGVDATRYTVSVLGDEGRIPHFHVFDGPGRVRGGRKKRIVGTHACVRLLESKYQKRNAYRDELPAEVRAALDAFMRAVRTEGNYDIGLGKTNFQHAVALWNEENDTKGSSRWIDSQATQQPNYATIAD